ncbi:class II aldolase/adducin family protein [Dietzia psychralcaliphila]|uniref:class II aldolase/adducin family protein n=1 Tax=Dietzia psychralcaliphila TaxID=139021 RepID=UPI001C1E8197|nr:class II aldolase/adducin family protein [Dietzia psychralcaliphila]
MTTTESAREPEQSSRAREHVAATARRLAAEGLLIGTAGNVSARLDDGRVAVTGTGVVLADCRAEDVTVVSATGEHVDGRLAPTSELGLHLGIYSSTQAGAVVHTHAPFSTAVSCVSGMDSLPVLHYQQLLLGGEIRVAPYATFGTPELADLVVAGLRDRQAVLMANHGSVAVGSSLAKALDNALLLEWLAALYVRASGVGAPRPLTEAQQHDAVVQAITLEYGTTKENPR